MKKGFGSLINTLRLTNMNADNEMVCQLNSAKVMCNHKIGRK